MDTQISLQEITKAIIATGLTQQALADLVPCSQAAICAFVNGNRGARPSYVIGQRLRDIHAERCGTKPRRGKKQSAQPTPS